MLKLSTVMIYSESPDELAKFYTKLLGEPGWSEGGFKGFDAGGPYLMVGPHDKVHGKNEDPARIIINFESDDVAGEYKRILDFGASTVAEPYHPGEEPDMWLATLADPEGNYIQLASPWKP